MTKSTPLSNPKLGKKSARKWAVAARFSDYFHVANLPTPPAVFGGPPPNLNWEGMLGNDRYGNCVCAGAAHETIYWDTFSKNPITTFTAEEIWGCFDSCCIKKISIFLERLPAIFDDEKRLIEVWAKDKEILKKWNEIFEFRKILLKKALS